MKYLLFSLIFLFVFSGLSHALMWSPDDPNRPKVMPESSAMSSESSSKDQEMTKNNDMNNQESTQRYQNKNVQIANKNMNVTNQNYEETTPVVFYLQMFAILIGVIFSLFLFFKILRSR
ncbi:hypothetical protein TDSAC_1384 [Thermodesulfobium acidiphilum]|uniref:Uncharacterized protein n=1 Tax=Thermodesulfobium acidiphilum TaxID=1794699 RepID=A0A2R4W1V2_THEAF|nr:hypothetical protein [Thermodesulfobium acidiphilum]AWB10724.1 hypothetical protein TDSAC_1384 [Thermodesulfobium acidiphilum]